MSIIFSCGIFAAPIYKKPTTIFQPDGTKINCFVSGDEFFNYLHDENGYTIIQAADGWFYYAQKSGETVKASTFRVNTVNPEKIGLQKFAIISKKEYQKNRKQRFSNAKFSKTKATGTLNNIVVFIRFSNETEFPDPLNFYNSMCNGNAPDANSMQHYFEEASYGQFSVSSFLYPTSTTSTVVSYQDSHPRSYYQPYNATTNPNGYQNSQVSEREHTLLKNAIQSIASQVPSTLNLDIDNDGNVDNLCFIVRGETDNWAELLWPHMWSLFTYDVYIRGKKVENYNLQIEEHLKVYSVGVLSHEMSHTIGSPDLYHYSGDEPDAIGPWDLMCSNTNPPQHLSAYLKFRYCGWITEIPTISAPNTYTLKPLNSQTTENVCYKIASPNSATEYFVVEYRRKTGIFENELPTEGLLVYRVNTDFDGWGNASYNGADVLDELYIYRPNGTTTVNGNISQATFNRESGRTTINNNTNPASFLSNGNPGGLDISNVSFCGNTISFDLFGGPICAKNIGIEQVLTPTSGANLSNQEVISVKLKNAGTETIATGLQISYQLNNENIVTETYNGTPIPSQEFAIFSFSQTANLEKLGKHKIKIFTSLPEDCNNSNDTANVTVVKGLLQYRAMNASTQLNNYQDLGANGNLIAVQNNDNANSQPVNIGFPFFYNTQHFTQFILNTNGFIKLGNISPSKPDLFFTGYNTSENGIFNSEDTADLNIIAPFNHDLTEGTSTTEFRVHTSGNAPNRICTIQFKNLKDKTTNSQLNNIEFQILLHETSNNISFVYGNWTPSNNNSEFKTAAVGIKGSANVENHLLVARKSSVAEWNTVIFENLNYSATSTLNFGNPPDRPLPTSGLTLQFAAYIVNLPTVSTLLANNITTNSAKLNATINAQNSQTNVIFEYGTDTLYGNSVPATNIVTGNSPTDVFAEISNLTPNTTYHYRAKATNAAGTTYGNDVTFKTLALPTPVVSTQDATNISFQTATLNATVNPKNYLTNVIFEFGTDTTTLDSINATPNTVSGATNKTVTASLSNLSEGESFYFRVKATNQYGTTFGQFRSFTTLQNTFNITFEVKDENNLPVQNAKVRFGEIFQLTNNQGITIFNNIPASDSISYQISKETFLSQEGFLNVNSSFTKTISLIKEKYSVTFEVKNSENAAIEGAEIEFYSQILQTNSQGIAVFENVIPADSLIYTISKEKFNEKTGKISVINQNVTEKVVLTLKTYKVTFTVLSGGSGCIIMPWRGATVDFGIYGKKVTDSLGKAIFENVTPTDSLPYTVYQQGYSTYKGTVNVDNQDVEVEAQINWLGADLTFKVTLKMLTKNTIKIFLDGHGEKIADANGIATFSNVDNHSGIFYRVSCEGFHSDSGMIFDNYDTVEVSLFSVGIENLENSKIFEIYPNPVSETLFLENKEIFENVKIEIISVEGKILYQKNETLLSKNSKISISVKDFPKGIYFLRLQNNENQTVTKKLIVK